MEGKLYVEVLNWASSFLEEQGLEPYIAEYLLLERQGWTKTELVSVLRQPVSSEIAIQWENDLKKVTEGMPPQYVIGSCEFFGNRFSVTPDTLIPRPETEELVQACLDSSPETPVKVLDIGTGTGAIALSLKKNRPNWDVTAVDISEAALTVAKENAQRLNVAVTFSQSDLTSAVAEQVFDVIVSNPPYIGEEEWDVMGESVREHEPKIALFAANHGLAIYERLAKELPKVSHDKTSIYLEIGYQQGAVVKEMFAKAMPSKTVRVEKDLFGQDRLIIIN